MGELWLLSFFVPQEKFEVRGFLDNIKFVHGVSEKNVILCDGFCYFSLKKFVTTIDRGMLLKTKHQNVTMKIEKYLLAV